MQGCLDHVVVLSIFNDEQLQAEEIGRIEAIVRKRNFCGSTRSPLIRPRIVIRMLAQLIEGEKHLNRLHAPMNSPFPSPLSPIDTPFKPSCW